jgi:hypothetical protein
MRRPVIAAAAALTVTATLAHADVTPRLAGLEPGDFREFTSTSVANGTLTTTTGIAYEGARSARATYSSASAANGYARAQQTVYWVEGDTVAYGAAFYLPAGFYSSLRGGVTVLRWDNWAEYGGGGDVGGLAVYHSDRRVHLIEGTYGGYETDHGSFTLPEGRWVHVEVVQRFGTADASAEVFVDGARVLSSSLPNMNGRPVTRLRVGVVSVAAGSQSVPVTVYFDRASIASSRVGPAGAVAGCP